MRKIKANSETVGTVRERERERELQFSEIEKSFGKYFTIIVLVKKINKKIVIKA